MKLTRKNEIWKFLGEEYLAAWHLWEWGYLLYCFHGNDLSDNREIQSSTNEVEYNAAACTWLII